MWCLDARLNIGATILHRNFRAKKKFEGRSLKVLMPTSLLNFNARLSLEQFSSFKAKLNKTPKMLLIDEDLAPLADKKLGVSPANLLNQPRHATWATCQPEGCVDGHTTNELIFFPPVYHFFSTLGCIFPNPTHIFPKLDVCMGPAICVHLGLISAPVGNVVFSVFCLKYLVPLLASVLCSNATVQHISRSGKSRVRAEVQFLLQLLFKFRTDTVTTPVTSAGGFMLPSGKLVGPRWPNTGLKYF